ncbi:hypothetical protein B0H13DRAFT_2663555 [Mycena leptocephala]|nr:hypothetical protein B0H13DRAFT_2663555 [Mycena leptocephala]
MISRMPQSTKAPSAPGAGSKSTKLMERATTSLEVAVGILEQLSGVTENVPYLNAITGPIQKLIQIHKVLRDNDKRARDLLNNIGEISLLLTEGLNDLQAKHNINIAITSLKKDLEGYERILSDTYVILQAWMSKGFVKRLLIHSDFPAIADGVDRKLNAFRDAFNFKRLIALSTGQETLHTKIQTLLDENTRKKLAEWLKPADVAISQRDAANKLQTGTGLWFLESAEFIKISYATSTFLWLQGICQLLDHCCNEPTFTHLCRAAGSGKTVLSSTIINSLRARAEPLVFFYFDTNNSQQQTVTQLLCSLVTQLSVQAPSPDNTLNALWTSYGRGQHLPANPALISDALIPILREFTKPVYIVLDALDECSERDKLIEYITKIIDAELANVHLILTSRPEVPRGTALFQRAVSISLEGCVDRDIEAYVTEMLAKFEFDWPEERKDQIKEALLERGGGMFRLVSLQLEQLRECGGSKKQVTKALSNMPTSLDTIYDRVLENIKDPDMISSVGRAMNWLIFSERPMELNEIIDALAFDFKNDLLRFDPEERMHPKALLAACAGLVIVSEDPRRTDHLVKLAHASVKEYFLSARTPLGDCKVSEQIAHPLIARTCIAYLCYFDESHPLQRDNVDQFPLSQYAAEYWPFHAKRGKEDSSLAQHIRDLLQCNSKQYITWIRIHNVDSPWPATDWRLKLDDIPQPLYYSALLGLADVSSALLKLKDNVNAEGGEYGTALQAASANGHNVIVATLLDKGANVNAEGGRYGIALQAASANGHDAIVATLLDNGANVNAEGGEYGTALQAASANGQDAIVAALLDKGANVNAEGGEYGTALQAASANRHDVIVAALLNKGANVNAEGGEYGTALQAASANGHDTIVTALLDKGANVNAEGGEYGTALQAASANGHDTIVATLLDKGANVNAEGGEYGTALQAASANGHDAIVAALLGNGANVNAEGGRYGTALYAALANGHDAIVAALGANVNAEGGEYDKGPTGDIFQVGDIF